MDDFNILDEMTNEELDVIVKLIVEKGWQTESLSKDNDYKKYCPDHKKYVDKIKNELSLMGGDTIANVARFLMRKSSSISYREMLKDVCKKLKIEYEESMLDEELERDLLATVLKRAFDKLSDVERNVLLEILGENSNEVTLNNLFYKIFADDNEKKYILSVLVSNTLAKTICGKDLSLLNDIKTINELKVLTAPLSSILMNVDKTYDITGPAYRITLPAIVYMASMKQIKNTDKNKTSFWNLF